MAAGHAKTGRDFTSNPPGAYRPWFRPARILLGIIFLLIAIATALAGLMVLAGVIKGVAGEFAAGDEIVYLAAFAYFLTGLASCGFLAAALAALHLLADIADVLGRIDYRGWRRQEGSA